MSRFTWGSALLATGALVLASCERDEGGARWLTAESPDSHGYFPIDVGAHAVDCAECHGGLASFREFSCVGCHMHGQEVTDGLHKSLPDTYAYDSAACYACHPTGAPQPFSHTGVPLPACATCHDVGAPFAALPRAEFTHPGMGTSDCGACHTTTTWETTGVAPGAVYDEAKNVLVETLAPIYDGTSIATLTPETLSLPMGMEHATQHVDAAAFSACANCHPGAAVGTYYPGELHAALEQLGVPQPTECSDCHTTSLPTGFVGPLATAPARTPPSGEMKHDAVLWNAAGPTTTRLVSTECGICHVSPSGSVAAPWNTPKSGDTLVRYHTNLAAPEQPGSCVDCHANSRATALLTSATAALPAGVTYDHSHTDAMGDCQSCHALGGATRWTSWTQGQFHVAGSASPTTCLPCHDGERPTSTAGWTSTTYAASPFDYGTNSLGILHGGGQDCAGCHKGSGTGAWGGSQNWLGGAFDHAADSLAGTTCIACHESQRPSAVVDGFDHTKDGLGDCIACHRATVERGVYVSAVVPGGDWRGGIGYPGDYLSASTVHKITVDEIRLVRNTSNRITGTSKVAHTLFNAMLHTSTGVPSELDPGPTGSPNSAVCWHCHTHDGAGNVTSLSNGIFHDALTNYSATPGGVVTPLPQPTACLDCHAQMLPSNIVQRAGSVLRPMDHAATFTAPTNIGGAVVSSVKQLDCAVCHTDEGGTWADGSFHEKIGGAVPSSCVVCHYTLMADTPTSDVTSGTTYKMVHGSAFVTSQDCAGCHPAALAKATQPVAASLWTTGTFHPSVPTQPTACVACHAVSRPTVSTQSTETYSFAMGGTASNGAQWMNHLAAPSQANTLDCAACHASDAKPVGSAWSKSSRFHGATHSAVPCSECHGVANGKGTVIGTNNNLPAGRTDSSTVTTAPTTAVPAGTRDQIHHGNLNVTSRDCTFCHTQVGSSAVTGIAGKEWAQARFHSKFIGGNVLQTNNTTARCSQCHLNVKPGAGYTAYSHATFTDVSGSQDCASCHTLPGTGTTTAPNWKGASGAAPADHDNYFPILATGAAHAAIGCGDCHTDLATPTNPSAFKCGSCHVALDAALVTEHTTTTSNTRIKVKASEINVNDSRTCLRCHADSQVDLTSQHPTGTPCAETGAPPHKGAGCLQCHSGYRTDKTFAANFATDPPPGCAQCHDNGRVCR